MIIAIDFDGTCVTHDFPRVGKEIGAIDVLRRIVEKGHKIILFTVRCNVYAFAKGDGKNITNVIPGNYLDDAVLWFVKNGIPLYGVNENPDQKRWSSSPKVFADLYIDDSAVGIPLIPEKKTKDIDGKEISMKKYVDWDKLSYILEDMKII